MSTGTPTPKKPDAKERLTLLWKEYGTLAIIVFVGLWIVSAVGLWSAVSLGWNPSPPEAGSSRIVKWLYEVAPSLAVTYLLMRVTMPLRIAGTLLLTPLVAKILERFGWRKPELKA